MEYRPGLFTRLYDRIAKIKNNGTIIVQGPGCIIINTGSKERIFPLPGARPKKAALRASARLSMKLATLISRLANLELKSRISYEFLIGGRFGISIQITYMMLFVILTFIDSLGWATINLIAWEFCGFLTWNFVARHQRAKILEWQNQ